MSASLDAAATAPIPKLSAPPSWKSTFALLQHHNYRRYMIAQVFANTAAWMQRIAADWLVLEMTGNVALVGLTIALQFLPTLVLGPYGGVLADRMPKRAMVIGAQTVVGILSALLAVLIISGGEQLWQVYLIIVGIGLAQVVDNPARAVFVNEIVGQAQLRNAISFNAMIFQFGALVGPAVSGVLIVVVGAGWAMAINAASVVLVVILLLSLRRADLRIVPRVRRSQGQLGEAARYIRRKPAILWTMVMFAFVAVFGMPMPALLSGMADTVYRTGATGYGLFNSSLAVGAVIGAILSTRRTGLRLRTVILSAAAFGVIQLVAGATPAMIPFMLLLVAVGVSRLLFGTAAESMTQFSSNLRIRGRVMSIYQTVIVGGQAVGGPIIGWLAEQLGPQPAMVISGAVPLAAALTIALILARSGKLRLRVTLSKHGPVGIPHVTIEGARAVQSGGVAA